MVVINKSQVQDLELLRKDLLLQVLFYNLKRVIINTPSGLLLAKASEVLNQVRIYLTLKGSGSQKPSSAPGKNRIRSNSPSSALQNQHEKKGSKQQMN